MKETSEKERKKLYIYRLKEAISTFNRVRVPYKKYNAYLDVIDSSPSWVTTFDPRDLLENAWETCL